MTERTCDAPSCDYPAFESQFICKVCFQQLRNDLGDLPTLLNEINTTMAKLDKLGVPGGRKSAETPLPFKPGAGDAYWEVSNTVTTWTRILIEHYHLDMPLSIRQASELVTATNSTAHAAAWWLRKNLRSLSMHPWAGRAVDEFAAAVALAYQAIDRPPELLCAGQCGNDGCEEYLYVHPDAKVVTCRACESRHNVVQRHAWMVEYASDLSLSPGMCLSWVKLLMGWTIPPGTWRSWLSRGQLQPNDHDHVGRPTFRFGDVRDRAIEWARVKADREEERARKPVVVRATSVPAPTRGEESPAWKGDDVGYRGMHHRLHNLRGTPTECGHCGSTEASGYEWALDWHRSPAVRVEATNGRSYSTDLDDYVRLCVPCHRAFDRANANVNKSA